MAVFGKRLTFTAFILALLTLLPGGLYSWLGDGKGDAVMLGLLVFAGFPFFSLLSLVGMLLWTVGEIRRQRGE